MRRVGEVLVVAVVLLAGCGSATSRANGPSGGKAAASSGSTTAPSPPTTAFVVATAAQLQAALLTQSDIGSPYVSQPSSGSDSGTKASGCPGLSNDLNSQSPSPGEINEEADFQAGETGPFVTETLLAEPQAQFLTDLKQAVDELTSCKELTISSSGTTVSFSLSPINFAPGSSAARLDGTYQGLQLNGYLAVQRVHDAGMLFFYFQIGSGSSQDASAIYSKALDKANANLP